MTQASTTPDDEFRHLTLTAHELWWIPVFTGILWVLFALLLFRFDWTTVHALAILVGVVCLAAALNEAIAIPAAHGWGRAGRGRSWSSSRSSRSSPSPIPATP